MHPTVAASISGAAVAVSLRSYLIVVINQGHNHSLGSRSCKTARGECHTRFSVDRAAKRARHYERRRRGAEAEHVEAGVSPDFSTVVTSGRVSSTVVFRGETRPRLFLLITTLNDQRGLFGFWELYVPTPFVGKKI